MESDLSRREVLASTGSVVAGSAAGLAAGTGTAAAATDTVEVCIHQTASADGENLAEDAYDSFGSQVNGSFNVSSGTTVDIKPDDKEATVQDLEDQLNAEGLLDEYHVHLITYTADRNDEIFGAGFNVWEVGRDGDDDETGGKRASYVDDNITRNYDGDYAFAFVMDTGSIGRFVRKYSILGRLVDWAVEGENYFKNTVIHETAHCLGADHRDGTIHEESSYFGLNTDYAVSPLATWYVESWMEEASKRGFDDQTIIDFSELCNPDAHQETAHTQEISFCTNSTVNRHISNYVDDLDSGSGGCTWWLC